MTITARQLARLLQEKYAVSLDTYTGYPYVAGFDKRWDDAFSDTCLRLLHRANVTIANARSSTSLVAHDSQATYRGVSRALAAAFVRNRHPLADLFVVGATHSMYPKRRTITKETQWDRHVYYWREDTSHPLIAAALPNDYDSMVTAWRAAGDVIAKLDPDKRLSLMCGPKEVARG